MGKYGQENVAIELFNGKILSYLNQKGLHGFVASFYNETSVVSKEVYPQCSPLQLLCGICMKSDVVVVVVTLFIQGGQFSYEAGIQRGPVSI